MNQVRRRALLPIICLALISLSFAFVSVDGGTTEPQLRQTPAEIDAISAAIRPQRWQRQGSCGVNVVYIFTALVTGECEYDAIYEAMNPRDEIGNSITEVRDAMSELNNVNPHVVSIFPRDLESIPKPAILFLERGRNFGHFIVLLDAADDYLEIIDGVKCKVTRVEPGYLTKYWTGLAIIQKQGVPPIVWLFCVFAGALAIFAFCIKPRQRYVTIVATLLVAGVFFYCSRSRSATTIEDAYSHKTAFAVKNLLSARLMEQENNAGGRQGSCLNTHVPYALAIILQANDRREGIVSPECKLAIENYLLERSTELFRDQSIEGYFSPDQMVFDWQNLNESKRRHYRKLYTGHNLEWIALVPDNLRPPRTSVRKAILWSYLALDGDPRPMLRKGFDYSVNTHTMNALLRLHHTSSQEAR